MSGRRSSSPRRARSKVSGSSRRSRATANRSRSASSPWRRSRSVCARATARTMRSSSGSLTTLTGASGVLRQISCHCMSAVGAPTHPDAGKPRADFCVSDLKGRTASREAMAARRRHPQELRLQRLGQRSLCRQRADRPHGAPARGVDSIQVEINKKLFMDTRTFRKTPGFERLKADLDRLLAVVVKDTPGPRTALAAAGTSHVAWLSVRQRRTIVANDDATSPDLTGRIQSWRTRPRGVGLFLQ